MPNTTARFFQTVAVLALGIAGAAKLNLPARQESDASPVTRVVHQPLAEDFVNGIMLPHDELTFPPGPGRQEFVTACVVCHSPRYITMQPRFSRSTWLSEVKKMKDVYGAHISDEQAASITEYLVFINGRAEAGNAPNATYGE